MGGNELNPYTKYRAKRILTGLAVIVATQLLVPGPITALAAWMGTIPGYLGFMGIIFLGAWLSGWVGGLSLIYLAFKKQRFETRYCSTCGKETPQFQSKEMLRQGFKQRTEQEMRQNPIWREEYKRNVVGYEYTCQSCGMRNTTSFAPQLLLKRCPTCKTDTPHSLKEIDEEFVSVLRGSITIHRWICQQCHNETIERINRT